MSSELVCWNCGASLADVPRPISRHATCGKCFNELHCCRMCRHYDPKRTMQCFEDRADPPLMKENANFCDFFAPTNQVFSGTTTTRADSARASLDDLFGAGDVPDEEGDTPEADTGNPEPETKADEARRKLDDLFS